MNDAFQHLLSENERMLDRFAHSGTDLNKTTQIIFRATFQNKADALKAKDRLRTHLRQPDLLYMTCNYDGAVDLEIAKEGKPNAHAITVIESALSEACAEFQGADVSWEFEGHD